MSKSCCAATPAGYGNSGYRRVLWLALAVNASMFAIELAASFAAGSTSLLADAVDFAGDAANYGISLGALALGAMWQSRAALVKGISMTGYGIFVLVMAAWRIASGATPEPLTMGLVGTLALAANVGVAAALYRYREGDANMRSVWLCSRNDAIGNVAVLLAALGVFGTGSAFPDLAVALIIASLGSWSGISTVRQALAEIRSRSGDGAQEHARMPKVPPTSITR